MGLIAVKPGEIAAVVTSLEMLERPRPRPLPDSPLRLVRWVDPAPAKYRALFQRVGAPWLWFSRLVMTDERLTGIIHDPALEIHAVADPRGIEIGLLELDFRVAATCELSFFGLVPELTGQGHGRWLMAQALLRAWRPDVSRVWVHTCTLDHPRALGFYRASGFAPYARSVETFADPRLSGHLPRDAAPHVPLIDPASRR
ncbi:GNAT family N-acetyltransferase [Sphingomonas turrisvirgatae]|uniref:GNAT family N-acetyltransferase n=1 Tax=Sphingomonas turrisvirgatae TaxID=1888892 RepID=A0A1E3LT44_9SPHN|nr:GNAT family N-acetyltransferase [Sphingomonas turrisvirgatae]ODP36899.1 GNAT family N-acetyltransferase [Sphingomonas turrisvirgatae]